MENNTEEKIREDLQKEMAKAEAGAYNKEYYAKNEKIMLSKACKPLVK